VLLEGHVADGAGFVVLGRMHGRSRDTRFAATAAPSAATSTSAPRTPRPSATTRSPATAAAHAGRRRRCTPGGGDPDQDSRLGEPAPSPHVRRLRGSITRWPVIEIVLSCAPITYQDGARTAAALSRRPERRPGSLEDTGPACWGTGTRNNLRPRLSLLLQIWLY
jgi:hypothetical protein